MNSQARVAPASYRCLLPSASFEQQLRTSSCRWRLLVANRGNRGRALPGQEDVRNIALAQHDVEVLHVLQHLRELFSILRGLLMEFLRYRLLLGGGREVGLGHLAGQ